MLHSGYDNPSGPTDEANPQMLWPGRHFARARYVATVPSVIDKHGKINGCDKPARSKISMMLALCRLTNNISNQGHKNVPEYAN